MIPMVCSSFQAERGFGEFRLFLPFAVTVRLIPEKAAVIPIHPHGAVSMVAVIGKAGSVDRNLMVIHPEAVALSIPVGKKPSLQHLVRREPDAGHHVSGVEG